MRPLVLVLALLIACGPSATTASPSPSPSPTPEPATPSPSPSAAIPAGWTPVTKKTDKATVTFALPPSWRVIDLDQATLVSSYERLAAANPDFAKAITLDQMKNLSASGLFVYAFDFDASTMRQGFVTNMNALTQSVKTTASVDVMAQTTAAQIEVQIKAKTIGTSKLRVGPLDAARNAYEYTLQKPDGTSVQIALEQYFMLADGYPHVLSFTTARAAYETYRTVFEQIALTYRVG